MSELSISIQIPNRFYSFLKDGKFSDVELVSSGKKFQSHKIFLTKESKWFGEYFRKNAAVKSVSLPCDPEGKVFNFLESVYSGSLNVDTTNFACYMKCAEFYGFDIIYEKISDYVSRIVTKQNVLQVSTLLSKYKLDREASKYRELLYFAFSNAKVKSTFYKCVTPVVFAEVLKWTNSNEFISKAQGFKLKKLTNEEKVQIIDDYEAVMHNVKTEEEKQALSSVIKWSQKDSYLFVVKYNCDWAPASVTRSLYSKALSMRRLTTKGFEKDTDKVQSVVSRWFPLSWFDSIGKTTGNSMTPVVNAIELITTFGGHQKFNPVKYMTIDVASSPSIGQGTKAEHMYSVDNIFADDENYFVSKEGSTKNPPFVSFSFGKNIVFSMKSIFVNSKLSFTGPKTSTLVTPPVHMRNGPAQLDLEIGIGGAAPSQKIAALDFKDSSTNKQFDKPVNLSSVKLAMTSPSTAGWWNLRIANVEVVGQFLPK